MKCLIIECSKHDDCVIIDITKKQPKDAKSCSYFKTEKQAEKKTQKRIEEQKTPTKKKK